MTPEQAIKQICDEFESADRVGPPSLLVCDDDGNERLIPMREDENGDWFATPGGDGAAIAVVHNTTMGVFQEYLR